MSDPTFEEALESLNTRAEARQSRRETGEVTAEDLEQGRVDPTDILSGDATIEDDAGQSLHVRAEDLQDERVRSAYGPHTDSRGVVVHLSGDNEVDAVAKKWANETGASVQS